MNTYLLTMPFDPHWPYFELLRNRIDRQQSIRLTAKPNEVYIIFSKENPPAIKVKLLDEIPADPALRLVLISNSSLFPE
jgi:hypothetical protein